MMVPDKAQVGHVVIENRIPLSSSSFPLLNQVDVVRAAAGSYGFTLHEEKLAKLVTHEERTTDSKYSGAVLLVRGPYSVDANITVEMELGRRQFNLLVFQQSVVDGLNRTLAASLVKAGAVELYPECDTEYLYEALVETTETLFFQLSQKVAFGLPLFQVTFAEDASSKIEDLGVIGASIAGAD